MSLGIGEVPKGAACAAAPLFVALLLAWSPQGWASSGEGAADWPRLWGPAGDARALASGPFSPGKPIRVRELWRRPLGSAFAAVSIVGHRGYTGISDGERDHVVALDVATGRELWRSCLGPTYRGHDGSKDGPVSTPTVDGGRVFALGPHGVLMALDAGSGKQLWQHDLVAELGAKAPAYGFGTAPLVVGARLIVQAGGATQHNLVAFDTSDGRLLWSVQHSNATGYASPVKATIAGEEQVVVLAADKLFAVRPRDGGLLWSHSLGTSSGEASRSPLILPGDRVLAPTGSESVLVQVSGRDGAFTASERWKSPRLKGSFSPTVYHDGFLYGFNGGFLTCLDLETAEPKWRERVYGGSLILVGGHLVVLGESSGNLHVAEATEAGFREKVKLPVFNAGAASVTGPSFGDGLLLLRNVEEMVAFEVEG
jgi:outer membrane protein assembly factor BamB